MRAMILIAFAGCVGSSTLDIPNADPVVFREQVYPVLLQDCGFNTCHGTTDRFFSVFGPGRARLDPGTAPFDPATPYEMAHSYTRAESMLFGPDGARTSLLLRKPIPLAEGGTGHEGDDPWGDSVYPDVNAPHFVTIYRWATAGER